MGPAAGIEEAEMMDRTAEYSALGFPQLCKFVEKSLRRHYVEKEDAIEVLLLLFI